MLAETGFASGPERWSRFEVTKRPEGLQKLWRVHSGMSVFAVHALASPHAPSDFASAAPVHRKQGLMAVMKKERPKTTSQSSIVSWSQSFLREKSAERK
jgi:hypothetical protein